MTKYFCDRCNEEITPSNDRKPSSTDINGRLTRVLDEIGVTVSTSVGGVWNAGSVCKSCVLYVVANGIDK